MKIASQNVYQPQPAVMEVASYQSVGASADNYISPARCDDSVSSSRSSYSGSIHWVLGVGGQSASADSPGSSETTELGTNWANTAGVTWENRIELYTPTMAREMPKEKQTPEQLLGYERDPRKRSSPTSD